MHGAGVLAGFRSAQITAKSADVTTISATTASGSVNDTTLTVTYVEDELSTDATKRITMLRFAFLGTPTITPLSIGSGNFGYLKDVMYPIFMDSGKQQLQSGYGGITVTETISGCTGCIIGNGSTFASSQVGDKLGIVSSQPLPSNFSEIVTQSISIAGNRVRNNTLTFKATTVTIQNNGPTS